MLDSVETVYILHPNNYTYKVAGQNRNIDGHKN